VPSIDEERVDGEGHEEGVDGVARFDPQTFVALEPRPSEESHEPLREGVGPSNATGDDRAGAGVEKSPHGGAL